MSGRKSISSNRLATWECLRADLWECLREQRCAGKETMRALDAIARAWGASAKWLYRLYSGENVLVSEEQQRRYARAAIGTFLELAAQHVDDVQRCVWQADEIRKRDLPDDDMAVRKEAARVLFLQADVLIAAAKRCERQAHNLHNEQIPGLDGGMYKWSAPVRRRYAS